MASHTQDDGFHEIQLNGKQLVFLFMAATVVSVVIFLCGVLVGRDVGGKRSTATDSAASSDGPAADPVRESSGPSTGSNNASGQDPTKAPAPPVPTPDELSYPDRLNRSASSEESFRAASPKPDAPSPVAKQQSGPAASAKEAAPAASMMAAPGPGFAVQVAAIKVRSEADAIARRLSAKGYSAYVQPPASGKPNVYRVRVGTFKTKREADSVAARLKKEEKFTPWVTR